MNWYFILVEPAVPENVGAAARAMKTMGFGNLRLINPCDFREGKAKWVAHASGEILDNAMVYTSFEAAVSDIDFVVATSAKTRSVKGDHHHVDKLTDIILNKKQGIDSVAIVFGREESGLTNDEMRRCHISTYIPMATTYPSLNLAQAVMIYAWFFSQSKQKELNREEALQQSKFTAAVSGLKELLAGTRIEKNPNIYNRIFERMALMGDNDINLLMSIAAALKEKYSENTKR